MIKLFRLKFAKHVAIKNRTQTYLTISSAMKKRRLEIWKTSLVPQMVMVLIETTAASS
jgi:hypothetical protein